jgi:hypothetical protein
MGSIPVKYDLEFLTPEQIQRMSASSKSARGSRFVVWSVLDLSPKLKFDNLTLVELHAVLKEELAKVEGYLKVATDDPPLEG